MRKKRTHNPKIRYTKNGTPVVIERKIAEGLYIVTDVKTDGITVVAEEDLEK